MANLTAHYILQLRARLSHFQHQKVRCEIKTGQVQTPSTMLHQACANVVGQPVEMVIGVNTKFSVATVSYVYGNGNGNSAHHCFWLPPIYLYMDY